MTPRQPVYTSFRSIYQNALLEVPEREMECLTFYTVTMCLKEKIWPYKLYLIKLSL